MIEIMENSSAAIYFAGGVVFLTILTKDIGVMMSVIL
jgi:hypothetical protein